MATYKIFERKDKVSKKGVPLIFLIRHESNAYKIATGYHCTPGSWNQEGQSIITIGKNKDPKAIILNSKLKRAGIALEEIMAAQLNFNINQIRKAYKMYLKAPNEFSVKNIPAVESTFDDSEVTAKWNAEEWLLYYGCENKELFMLFERIIHLHKNDWSDGHSKKYRSLRSKILDFQPNFHVNMLCEEWWKRFVNYCIEERENVSNTINADAKVMRGFIKELRGRGFVFEHDLERKIQWRYIEPEKQALTWDKVLKIQAMDLDYPSDTINDSRKLWLAGAFTGRRWAEILDMTESNFYQTNGQWKYRNIGKGQKTIDIPLLPEAVEFFKRIKFKLPKLTGQTVNKDIKTICRVAGFKDSRLIITPYSKSKVTREVVEEWTTVTFHTGRHSYAHRIVEIAAGRPHAEKFISYMLGHSSFATTWKYINRSQSSNEAMFDDIIIDYPLATANYPK